MAIEFGKTFALIRNDNYMVCNEDGIYQITITHDGRGNFWNCDPESFARL